MTKIANMTGTSQKVECKRLKTLLFDAGITYVQIAKKIGISENNLNHKINGKRRWWIDECVIVTKLLGFNDLKEVFPEIFDSYIKDVA